MQIDPREFFSHRYITTRFNFSISTPLHVPVATDSLEYQSRLSLSPYRRFFALSGLSSRLSLLSARRFLSGLGVRLSCTWEIHFALLHKCRKKNKKTVIVIQVNAYPSIGAARTSRIVPSRRATITTTPIISTDRGAREWAMTENKS